MGKIFYFNNDKELAEKFIEAKEIRVGLSVSPLEDNVDMDLVLDKIDSNELSVDELENGYWCQLNRGDFNSLVETLKIYDRTFGCREIYISSAYLFLFDSSILPKYPITEEDNIQEDRENMKRLLDALLERNYEINIVNQGRI